MHPLGTSQGIDFEESKAFSDSHASRRIDTSYEIESDEEEEGQQVVDAAAIAKDFDACRLDELQSGSAKDYFQKVMYRINLDSLYKVIGSCSGNPDAEFCAVLVEIVQKEIAKRTDAGKKKFLLQVWSNQGELVYERKLAEPVANWSISTNKLLFQEEIGSSTVCVVKLSLDSRATLYEIELPQAVLAGSTAARGPPLRRRALSRDH